MAITRFVDAHIHLWDLEGTPKSGSRFSDSSARPSEDSHIRYPWLSPPFSDDGVNGSVEPIAKTYLLKDYLEDAQGCKPLACVHIDAGANPDDALKETVWLQNMADETGFPQAIVGYAPFHDANVEALLVEHCRHKNMRGIRQILNWHPNPYYSYTPRNFMDDPQWEKGFALLSKYNLSFDLQIYPLQMVQAAKLGAKYDRIPLMLNHAGMPVNDGSDYMELWLNGLKVLAQVPHASVKLSGFGLAKRDWTTKTIRPWILRIIDLFGPERVMFASDFPTDKLFSSFERIIEAYDEITADFSASERDLMFADNAMRLYRLNLQNI